MMSVDDFTTMLAYLVRVAWAAAAGQLHLASTPDGADADGDMSRLQGGVCAMQKDVSSKVSRNWMYFCDGLMWWWWWCVCVSV